MAFGQTNCTCRHDLNRERIRCKAGELGLPVGWRLMAGPLAGGKAEVLSIGPHAVSRNTGTSGEHTPCFSGLASTTQLWGATARCGIDGVSAIGRNTEHSFELSGHINAPWLLNSALCTWRCHGTYHCLPAFNACRDEESLREDPGQEQTRCSFSPWGPGL